MNVIKTKEHPLGWVRAFQRKLYCAAKKSESRTFGILYDKVARKDVLHEAWKRVSRKNGCGGIDRRSVEWLKEEYGIERFLEEIRSELLEESYKSSTIRRVYIPKENGEERPLGIPTVKDRVVQMAVKLIIEPLFEANFMPFSYGFRPCRSGLEAVKVVHNITNRQKWVVDIDLKNYFDTIPHEELMACVRRRVSDKKILALIRQWLKAGIMEEGGITVPEAGSPQGGVLSPLLSNIYLHEFDRQWDERKGQLIRYADDMVIICWSEKTAKQALETAEKKLTELGLELNNDKTKVSHIRNGFDFLGFTFVECYSHQRKRYVRIKFPRSKSMKKIKRKVKEAIKSFNLGTPLRIVLGTINPILRGWANYFRMGNSYEAAQELTAYTCRQLRIFWRRRKQRKDIQGIRKWTNAFFYEKGVYYVPYLLRS